MLRPPENKFRTALRIYADLYLQVAHPPWQLLNTTAMFAFPPIEGVKGQLQPIRSSHFVEDPKQVVPDSVLTQFQLLGYVTIGHAFGYEMDDSLFPFGQQDRYLATNRFGRRRRAQSVDQEV